MNTLATTITIHKDLGHWSKATLVWMVVFLLGWALTALPLLHKCFYSDIASNISWYCSHFHQHWDGMGACTQTVPKDLGQVVVSLEMAASTPSAGAVDPIQHSSNINKIAIPVYPRPDGYIKKHFDNKTTQKIAEIWDISPECVFYLFPVIDVKCICPIATCTSGLATFQGYTIKDHLARYHPNISKEESISCVRKSHKESQCGKRRKKTVQGRHYAQHFREMHLDVHFKCPFCGTTSTRINNLVTHFCKCVEVEKALTM
ncbi:hypothetical protein EV421DRAFT_1364913 [Armillaria borealis]|uniref:Uncharacterized protein n=1 Tax=Armillaria borealis TaxID=47425 RepID=A0AA39J2C3_9AGAR|nr:hypothetical protein EV421DRAFT_1364913 [Armillaria borealis]